MQQESVGAVTHGSDSGFSDAVEATNSPPTGWGAGRTGAVRVGGSALALVALFTLGGCVRDDLAGRCVTDADCAANLRCDAELGCVCASDAACGPDAFCNGRSCQRRVGCESSLECPAGWFCDLTTGLCLEGDTCTTDVQCAFGEVCDPLRFRCADGCRSAGDCRLGQVCRCAQGETCALGTCEDFFCDDDSYCRYGERCIAREDGTKRCEKDERGPYCGGCQLTPGAVTRCPGQNEDDANFCLLDRKVEYQRIYCGVDCSRGQACPRGYACRNILRLTSGLCGADSDCPANGPTCESDADCPGARCDLVAGRCAGTCSFNEDSKQGFCTCSADTECPQDVCDPVTRRCSVTRVPCSLDGDECRRIYCVNQGDRAACLIGQNCVPDEGITCDEIIAQQAE